MKTRIIRLEIVLADGGQSFQRFEVDGVDDAELERAADAFAKGALAIAAVFRDDEILSFRIGWADAWTQPPVPAPHADSIN